MSFCENAGIPKCTVSLLPSSESWLTVWSKLRFFFDPPHPSYIPLPNPIPLFLKHSEEIILIDEFNVLLLGQTIKRIWPFSRLFNFRSIITNKVVINWPHWSSYLLNAFCTVNTIWIYEKYMLLHFYLFKNLIVWSCLKTLVTFSLAIQVTKVN